MHLKKLPAAFYRSAAGNEPVREWLRSLDGADRRVVGQDIATAEFGWPVGMPVCRPLRRGLYEIRSDLVGGRVARVIFCIARGRMVLLHAFMKKTQRTPQPDIDLAMQRKNRGETLSKKRRASRRTRGRLGSSFAAFLKQEGTYAETSAVAIKRVIAWQLEVAMRKQGVSKNEMAKRMRTSRSHLDRILDPDNDRIQLDTVFKAARVLGREISVELV